MRFGYHCSISGGLTRAVAQGLTLECECMQIFSRNPRGWASKPLAENDAAEFRRKREEAGLSPLAVHLPYLPNLASADEELRRKSTDSLTEEMERAALIGARFVVAHPGHAGKDEPREPALKRVSESVALSLKEARAGEEVTLLLETTSGQRGELGETFEELAAMLGGIESSGYGRSRVGVCLDTAHIWAAGYDLAGPKAQDRVMDEFHRLLGLERLHFIHLNDSLAGMGARRDRHAAAGKGKIGSRHLARFVRRPELAGIGAIMETPFVSIDDDLANIRRVKRWRDRKRS